MAQIDDRYARDGTAARTDAAVDEGLRAYMVRVFNYMAGGVFLTGLVAYATFSAAVVERAGPGRRGLTEFGQLLYNSPFKWAVMVAPLAFVFFLSFRVNRMSVGAAQLSFWLFAAVMGLSLSSIFLVFTGESITQVFFVTAAAFGALSLHGYTTKRDLSAWGTFLFMGVVGVGVLLGGLLTGLFDWRSIFLVNLPIGGLVLFLSLRLLPVGKSQGSRHLDVAGAVTITASLLLAVYAVVNGEQAGWTSGRRLG